MSPLLQQIIRLTDQGMRITFTMDLLGAGRALLVAARKGNALHTYSVPMDYIMAAKGDDVHVRHALDEIATRFGVQ